MRSLRTQGIVLGRIEYGEADRIITFLTPDHGKLRLMARGVRKVKSKLAGGIELFSTSDISFLSGKGDIGTLVSARLITHYGAITADLDRLNLGYDLIKQLNKTTEDHPESEYYGLLEQAFQALASTDIDPGLIRYWFLAQLLQFGGHAPNLQTDTAGNKLTPGQSYGFDFDSVAFTPKPSGVFTANHIKTLRLLFSTNLPQKLAAVQGIADHLPAISQLLRNLQDFYLHH